MVRMLTIVPCAKGLHISAFIVHVFHDTRMYHPVFVCLGQSNPEGTELGPESASDRGKL